MKFLTAALVGALIVISTTQGYKEWLDPDTKRAARVAGYVACIQPCLQEHIADPSNADCHVYYPDAKKCLATVLPTYLPCVEKCTGRKSTPPAENSTAPAGYFEDDDMDAIAMALF
ncbi:hypothetical protein BGW39_002755 [Mortierella sp. 14UC]|nr:hypothetical protein BGW39_002755 [Mortierella sp. 14UC]